MILVIGGSASGKSAYAEKLVAERKEADAVYYIATMEVQDKEDRERVNKHRKMRDGKGFLTIEQTLDVGTVTGQMQGHKVGRCCALLESVSDLTANEMFCREGTAGADAVSDKIVRDIAALDDALLQLIVVTDNVFEDGVAYDERTMEYRRALGEINRRLSEKAAQVFEVVAGIPVAVRP